MKLLLGFVLLFGLQKQLLANPLVLTPNRSSDTTSQAFLNQSSHLNNEAGTSKSLKPWMRWGGLALLSVGTLLYVNTDEQFPQTVGMAGAGLGFAGFVWSFRF
ncbi:hypothetical protein OAU52_00475 [bacterium]|nr:hypothetical protein [bacterium]